MHPLSHSLATNSHVSSRPLCIRASLFLGALSRLWLAVRNRHSDILLQQADLQNNKFFCFWPLSCSLFFFFLSTSPCSLPWLPAFPPSLRPAPPFFFFVPVHNFVIHQAVELSEAHLLVSFCVGTITVDSQSSLFGLLSPVGTRPFRWSVPCGRPWVRIVAARTQTRSHWMP